MPRLLALLLGLAVALAPDSVAAPVPKHLFPKDPVYFPTQVGAEWVCDDNGHTYKFKVTDVEMKDGVALVAVGIYQSDDKTTQHFRTVEVSKKGLREVTSSGRKCEPPIPLLRLPHVPGDKWKSPFVLDGDPRGSYEMTAGKVEEITVPAGTFQALRVDTVSNDTSGKVQQLITTWYAPNVGPVRIQYASNASRDLVSFTPGKGAPPK